MLALPKTEKLIRTGMEQGLHIGAQLHLRLKDAHLDLLLGFARPGVEMSKHTRMLWLSTGKPLTAIAIAKLLEKGQLNLHDPVATYLPEFAQAGKEKLTLWHLLTHTGGFRRADKISPATPWEEMIQKICATPLEEGWVPGETAGYHPASAWFILGEIIQRIAGQPFSSFLTAELLRPLNMHQTSFALDPVEIATLGNKLGIMHSTSTGQPRPLPLENESGLALPRPGSSARGPIHEIANFYQMLLQKGAYEEKQILREQTVNLFLKPHRVGRFDATFMHTIDFGLGFILNSNCYGVETIPYSYGRFCSDGTFGHSGAESSCAFADPAHHLIVAWVLNGLCGEKAHQKRARELNSAIYEDLGLAAT